MDVKERQKGGNGGEAVSGHAHGKGEGPLLGTHRRGSIPDRAAVCAKATRVERVVLSGDRVVEEGFTEDGPSSRWLVTQGCAHLAPVTEHMSKKGWDSRWELAKIQGRGEKELALVELAVGMVKVLPYEIFPDLGGGVEEASHPCKAEGGGEESGVQGADPPVNIVLDKRVGFDQPAIATSNVRGIPKEMPLVPYYRGQRQEWSSTKRGLR